MLIQIELGYLAFGENEPYTQKKLKKLIDFLKVV